MTKVAKEPSTDLEISTRKITIRTGAMVATLGATMMALGGWVWGDREKGWDKITNVDTRVTTIEAHIEDMQKDQRFVRRDLQEFMLRSGVVPVTPTATKP